MAYQDFVELFSIEVHFEEKPWSLNVSSSTTNWPQMSCKATCFTWKAKRLKVPDPEAAFLKVNVALLLDSFSLRKVLLHTRKRGNVESYSSQETAVPTDTPVVTMTIAAAMTPASCRPRESWTSTFPVPCRRRKRNNSFSLRLITAIQVKPHLLLPLSQVLLATRSSVYGEHLK